MPDSTDRSLLDVIEKLNDKVDNLGKKVDDVDAKKGPLGDLVMGLQKANEQLVKSFKAPLEGLADGFDSLKDSLSSPFKKMKKMLAMPMKGLQVTQKLFNKGKKKNGGAFGGDLMKPLTAIQSGIDKLVNSAASNIPVIANSSERIENNTEGLSTSNSRIENNTEGLSTSNSRIENNTEGLSTSNSRIENNTEGLSKQNESKSSSESLIKIIEKSASKTGESFKISSVVLAKSVDALHEGNYELLSSIDKSISEVNENASTDRLQQQELKREKINREERLIEAIDDLGDNIGDGKTSEKDGFSLKSLLAPLSTLTVSLSAVTLGIAALVAMGKEETAAQGGLKALQKVPEALRAATKQTFEYIRTGGNLAKSLATGDLKGLKTESIDKAKSLVSDKTQPVRKIAGRGRDAFKAMKEGGVAGLKTQAIDKTQPVRKIAGRGRDAFKAMKEGGVAGLKTQAIDKAKGVVIDKPKSVFSKFKDLKKTIRLIPKKIVNPSFLKRVPIVGSLIEGIFANSDIKNILADPTLNKAQKNEAIGERFLQAIGGPAGAAIGASILGSLGIFSGGLLSPLGAFVGAVGGDMAGRFVASQLAKILPTGLMGAAINKTFYDGDYQTSEGATADLVPKASSRNTERRSGRSGSAATAPTIPAQSLTSPRRRGRTRSSSPAPSIQSQEPTTGNNILSKINENNAISSINNEARSAATSAQNVIVKGGDSSQVNNTVVNSSNHIDRTMGMAMLLQLASERAGI